MAIYTVNISQAGEYVLWGRVSAPSQRSDSFFVQIDNGLNNLWDVKPGAYWHWDEVNNRNKADPVTFILAEGVHTIKVKLREHGTKLDKLLLTNFIGFVPSGKGDIAENQPEFTSDDGELQLSRYQCKGYNVCGCSTPPCGEC